MNRKREITKLLAAFPNVNLSRMDSEYIELLTETWTEDTAEFDDEVFTEAVKHLRRSSEYCPSLPELVAECNRRKPKLRPFLEIDEDGNERVEMRYVKPQLRD